MKCKEMMNRVNQPGIYESKRNAGRECAEIRCRAGDHWTNPEPSIANKRRRLEHEKNRNREQLGMAIDRNQWSRNDHANETDLSAGIKTTSHGISIKRLNRFRTSIANETESSARIIKTTRGQLEE